MRTTFDSRRHPIAGCAVVIAALLVAGCGQDDAAMSLQNAPMAQVSAQDYRNASGPAYAQGYGNAQGYSNAQYSGNPRAPGNAQSYGNPQAPGNPQAYGNPPGPGHSQGPGAQGAGYPQGPGYAPGRGEPGNPARMAVERSGGALDELMAWERQDMGVRPARELHSGAMHGPTPNQIPGGQVITTKGLLPLLQQGIPVYVFDVLGTAQTLPNAIPASWAAEPGSFDDPTQQQLAQMLQQVTRGNPDAPLVFYCQGPQCWMSYNAALRTIALGYRNVLWYRGGMEAWHHAGQQFVPAQRPS